MTTEIDNILTTIAATGASESSDPLRAYINSLEQQINAFAANNTMEIDAQTAPLRERIATLEAEVQRLEAILSAIRAALAPTAP